MGDLAPTSFRSGYLAPYSRTRKIIFEACLFWFKERGMLYLKHPCFALWLIERGIFHLKHAK